MNLKEVEKIMYEDEEFLKYLPLLQEQYWKKAKPNKRLQFFSELQRIINQVDSDMPKEVKLMDRKDDSSGDPNVGIHDEKIFINEVLLKKTLSPYDVIMNYVFELQLIDNLLKSMGDDYESVEDGLRMRINSLSSPLGDWTNLIERNDPNFYNQPLVHNASNSTSEFIFNLLVYMNNNYGMDCYIGSKASGIMLGQFSKEKMKEKTDENYRIMEENARKYKMEFAKLNEFYDFLTNVNIDELDDDQFYGLFNTRILNASNIDTHCYLFSKFLERELKDYDNLEEVLNSVGLDDTEEYGLVIQLGDVLIEARDLQFAFLQLVIYVSNIKLREGLCTEIEDKEFLEDAKRCYIYLNEVSDGNYAVPCKYLAQAFSYYEYRAKILEHYYNKIANAIKKSEFFNTGEPFVPKGDFSKYEAYLQFGFNLTYDEVKRIQFETLEKEYKEVKGGRK